MDDRKYRQHGYQDTDRGPSDRSRDDKPRPQGLRPPLDVTGPRLPRLVQAVAAARCYNCAVQLPAGVNFAGNCPKCNADLHCCKQCAHFEPSTRFQCLQPVPERIPVKDKANECTLFSPRVTVARDGAPPPAPSIIRERPNGNGYAGSADGPRTQSDARAAFDRLFKK